MHGTVSGLRPHVELMSIHSSSASYLYIYCVSKKHYTVCRGGHRISARGGGDSLGTKLFPEIGANLKKKDNIQEKRNKTQEK